MKLQWKDVLIGVLVAYVAIDLVMACMIKGHTTCVEKLFKSLSTSKGLMVLVIGVAIGVAAWYFSSQSKEY
jgi:uncharacterized membrane protein